MADITQTLSTQDPTEFLGRSRGFDVPREIGARSFGNTFTRAVEAVGDIVPVVARAGDQLIKRAVDEEIYSEADKLQREFGVDDTILANNEQVPEIPAELERSVENLKRLQTALAVRAISETTYDTKLASVVSGLRAKYTGSYMRDYIDTKVSEVTGIRPQNKIRQDVFRQAEQLRQQAASVASDKERRHLNLLEEFYREGIAQKIPNVQSLDYESLQRAGAPFQALNESLTRSKRAIELETASRTMDKTRMLDLTLGDTRTTINTWITQATKEFGALGPEFQRRLESLASAESKDFSPEQLSQVTQQLAKARAELTNAVMQQVRGSYAKASSNGTNIPLEEDDLKAHLREIDAFFSFYENAVKSKDVTSLAFLKNNAELTMKRADYAVSKIPDFEAAGAVSRIVGPEAGKLFAEHLFRTSAPEVADRNMKALYRALGYESPILQELEGLSKSGVQKSADIDRVVKSLSAVMSSPGVPQEGKLRAFRSAINNTNTELFKKVPGHKVAQYFSQLFSADAYKFAKEMQAAGDSKPYDEYIKNINDVFPTAIERVGRELEAFNPAKGNVTVVYNPETAVFSARVPMGRGRGGPGFYGLDKTREFVDRLNITTRMYRYVLEQEKEPNLLSSLDVRLFSILPPGVVQRAESRPQGE